VAAAAAVVFLSVLTAGPATGIKRPQTRGQRRVNISNHLYPHTHTHPPIRRRSRAAGVPVE